MKPVPGYEGLYSIGSDGRLFAHRRRGSREKQLCGYRDEDGYLIAVLTRNYKRWAVGIHRIVALTWLGDPGKGFEINHKNGVRNDNRVANLEWVTHRENCLPDRALSLMSSRCRGEDNGSAKLSPEHIREIFRLRGLGLSQQAIAGAIGIVKQPQVSRILHGHDWTHLTS